MNVVNASSIYNFNRENNFKYKVGYCCNFDLMGYYYTIAH